MDAISDFVNEITAYQINVPISVQIGIIVVLIVMLCIGGYFMRDVFDVDAMRSGFSWFIFVAVLNLVSLLVIFLYYNTKQGTYKGPVGKVGNKGKIGKKGTSVSCSLCKNNLYLQKIRSSDIICNLYSYVPEFKSIFIAENYFDVIIQKGNNIDYDSFIKNLILKQKLPDSITSSPINFAGVDYFRKLLDTNSITVLLIKAVNETTKATENMYGSFRHPVGIQGKYLPLGDSAYGGSEYGLELNSFMADGSILYPSNYSRLVSFRSFNKDENTVEKYTIWRPNGQTITEPGFKGVPEQVQYKSLGDICRTEDFMPNINESLTISEKCVEMVHTKDLDLVFIFIGNIQINTENIGEQRDSYLIQSLPINDIEIFSIWRTPLNTFLTNCNSTNVIINNTFIYNMYNVGANTDVNTNIDETAESKAKQYNILNNYGNISSAAKVKASNLLDSIQIPKLLAALILCKYYETELLKDLVYYINLYRTTVPEFTSINTQTSSLGDLMNLINNVNTKYDDYNDDILRSFTLENVTTKYTQKEKHLPPMILNIYNNSNNKLYGMTVQIANTNTLLDIVNIIFENGIESRIAVNSDGIAQGGIFMNSIQEVVLRVCKMLMPPNIPAYTIKDECLGTFALDRKRNEIINEFIDVYNYTIKIMEDIFDKCKLDIQVGLIDTIMTNVGKDKTDYNLDDAKKGINDCTSLIKTVKFYITYTLNYKVGQICNHIDNYIVKIQNGNLAEFTTSRIKNLISLYTAANIYLKKILDSA